MLKISESFLKVALSILMLFNKNTLSVGKWLDYFFVFLGQLTFQSVNCLINKQAVILKTNIGEALLITVSMNSVTNLTHIQFRSQNLHLIIAFHLNPIVNIVFIRFTRQAILNFKGWQIGVH